MLWWFAETSLVAGLLAALAAALTRLRPITPTTRHLLWLAVLIKFATPPLISSPWAVPWPAEAKPAAERSSFDAPITVSAIDDRRAPHVVGVGRPSPDEPRASLATTPAVTVLCPPPARIRSMVDREVVRRLAVGGWLVGAVAVGLVQLIRIHRFQRRLRHAVPAPAWLLDEAESIAARLGVRVPELLAVAELGSPMIWCLGAPKLLVPARLLKSIAADQWRGVLAHELAHLRRRDHWIRRLELAAELVWWWNPLYWVARRQLDAEAELACDAWVVWSSPDDRLIYAEVLLQICSDISHFKSPAPALSVAGSGPFFERRLNMILRDQTSCRPSPLALMGVCVLSLAALPSWTLATTPPPAPAAALSTVNNDDDRDKEDERKKDDKRKKEEDKSSTSADADVDLSDLEATIESTFGTDFEKSIEELAEKIGEQLGDGSEFAEKMEALGEEMEKKFGDGSEFAEKMEALGEKMEKKFGEGSDFAKKMESLGKDLDKKLGPGSKFEAKMKKAAEKTAENRERGAEIRKFQTRGGSPPSSGPQKAGSDDVKPDTARDRDVERDDAAESKAADERSDLRKQLSDLRSKADLARDAARKAREKERDQGAKRKDRSAQEADSILKATRDEARATARKAHEASLAVAETARKVASADRKARLEIKVRRPSKPEAGAAAPADRKARLKALEAKLQELAREIKELESEDAERD